MRRNESIRRMLASACIVALGLVGIIGSGGGALPLPGLPSDCPPGDDCSAPPPSPAATIVPSYITALVGAPVSYSAQTAHFAGTPTYQWSRSSDGGTTYVDIPGATASTYSVAGVNLGDDGAVFRVIAQSTNGSVSAVSHLAVSATPGLVFEDGEFQDADWLVTPLADSNEPAPAQTSERVPAGGNPGAYRKMVFTLPHQALAGRVFYTSLVAAYDPRAQGAIYVIDFAEDGIALQNSQLTATESTLLLEQAGRKYVANTRGNLAPDLTTRWSAIDSSASLRARDFVLLDGPVCASNEACPDFSTLGLPMRFGYFRLSTGVQGDVIAHGIDNWKVTVWRR